MAGTNNFLPFADAGGANVQDQAAYAASVERTDGYEDGQAPEAAGFNKAVRQSAAITNALAQLCANITGDDMLDNGVAADLIASFLKLFGAGAYDPPYEINANNGYICIPGTPFFFQYKDYSLVPGSASDIYAAGTWTSGALVFPKTATVTIIHVSCEPALSANGNMRSDWYDRNSGAVYTNGMAVSATPFTGRALALCQFTG